MWINIGSNKVHCKFAFTQEVLQGYLSFSLISSIVFLCVLLLFVCFSCSSHPLWVLQFSCCQGLLGACDSTKHALTRYQTLIWNKKIGESFVETLAGNFFWCRQFVCPATPKSQPKCFFSSSCWFESFLPAFLLFWIHLAS